MALPCQIAVVLADFALSKMAGVVIIFLTPLIVLVCWLAALLAFCFKDRKASAKCMIWGGVILAVGMLVGFGLFYWSN